MFDTFKGWLRRHVHVTQPVTTRRRGGITTTRAGLKVDLHLFAPAPRLVPTHRGGACPNCGRGDIRAGDAFCPRCRVRFVGPSARQPVKQARAVPGWQQHPPPTRAEKKAVKPVAVKAHTRAGKPVKATTRALPGTREGIK